MADLNQPLFREIISEAESNKPKLVKSSDLIMNETEIHIFLIMLTFYIYGVLADVTVFNKYEIAKTIFMQIQKGEDDIYFFTNYTHQKLVSALFRKMKLVS